MKTKTIILLFVFAALLVGCKKGQEATCATKMRELKGDLKTIGTKIAVSCPANCTRNTVYGSERYTTDSSVCTAAVHSGAISAASGGSVNVSIVKSNPSYKGTEANGVKTRDWASSWGSTAFKVK